MSIGRGSSSMGGTVVAGVAEGKEVGLSGPSGSGGFCDSFS